ncbi:n-acetylglutamate synthase [Algoriphagus formosus]|uniref:N-acetylglutamate synthase n=1 Tax=Algoriphagus formosus TaxID=2007308 RepID=A0A4R5V7B1_9BACT|nr:n-acetylglutamate synthase [Algoriphagus aquimaris]TDK47938.1 n-acetylglutamate synthase [Algoriphagus aquimaris]
MKTNYNQRKFKIVQTSGAGELDSDQIFVYMQKGEILTCTYSGVGVLQGNILGKVDPSTGSLIFTYHQLNDQGELSSGICQSTPEFLDSGKIRLHEKWEWLSGKKGIGESILEEI